MTDELYWLPEIVNWRERFAAISRESPDQAWRDIVSLARTRLNFTQHERLAKAITRLGGGSAVTTLPTKPIRLAVLGSSTLDHLLAAMRVGAARRELWVDLYTPAYGQYRQELEDQASRLYKFQPTTILFAFDALHLVSGISGPLSAAGTKSVVGQLIKRIEGLWSIAKTRLGAHVIQQTVLPAVTRLGGSNEHRLPWSQASLTRQINSELRLAADAAGVDLLSVDEAVEIMGLDTWFDQSLWHKAKQEIRPTAAPIYGDWLGRILAARQGRSSKCLVFDLDNTLWSGVIGDDGVGGIVLGEGNAIGEAHKAIQTYARNLARRGVILAVCSKNDESNAKLPFTSHPEMVLKLDDIACFVANWADKATNLRAIASSLNISLDSLVFVDDNPFERNIVRRELPMVMVPELPEDPSLYVRCVADAGYFELAQITEEDFARSQQYQANLKRQEVMNAATDLTGYLTSLRMKLVYGFFDEVNLVRVTQLINKTNQFNLTTRRYSEDDIRRIAASHDSISLSLRLIDEFGDNGIIAVVIAMPSERRGSLEIDTWLMSCRVLGRQIEQATLNILADRAIKSGAKTLVGKYVPTAKNGMVADHYKSRGFSLLEEAADGASTWMLQLSQFTPLTHAIEEIREE